MKKLTIENIKKQILNSEAPSLILFKNDSCYLCNDLWPQYKRLEKEFYYINFYFVDTQVERELSKIFSIDGVPSIYVIHEGQSWEIEYPEEGYNEENLDCSLRRFFE